MINKHLGNKAIKNGSCTVNYTLTNACGISIQVSIQVTITSVVVGGGCTLSASLSTNNSIQCFDGNQFLFTSTVTGGTAHLHIYGIWAMVLTAIQKM